MMVSEFITSYIMIIKTTNIGKRAVVEYCTSRKIIKTLAEKVCAKHILCVKFSIIRIELSRKLGF